jgi:hypothetical protein
MDVEWLHGSCSPGNRTRPDQTITPRVSMGNNTLWADSSISAVGFILKWQIHIIQSGILVEVIGAHRDLEPKFPCSALT